MIGLLFAHFVTIIAMSLQAVFTNYLIRAEFPEKADDSGTITGNIGLVGCIASLVTGLFISYALDLFGRKNLTVSCLFLAGVTLACQPLPNHLPGLYILQILTSVLSYPMAYTPFTVDYIAQSSLGMFNGYYSFLNTSAGVITSSGVIKLQEYVPV